MILWHFKARSRRVKEITFNTKVVLVFPTLEESSTHRSETNALLKFPNYCQLSAILGKSASVGQLAGPAIITNI